MKIFLISALIITCFHTINAQSVNQYEYVVVPTEFKFLNEPDKYQLNSLTDFLFEKYGFTSFLANEELPGNYGENPCKGLLADVNDNSGLLRTKLEIVLKDCRGKVIFVSEEGISRSKEYKTAYHEALREAFKSVAALNYKYDEARAVNADAEVQVEKEVAVKEAGEGSLPKSKKEAVQISQPDPKEEVVEAAAVEKNRVFVRENGVFYLENTDKGFRFFQKGMAEPFAELIASKLPKQFIYSSISGQGIAYFDEQGNLVVETLDASDNSTITKVYTLKAQ